MIRNDLKELLPENWRSMFSHRSCDPENYEVGVFTIEEKEKILVLNPDTLDIMEYFFDDKPDDYWIDLEFFFKQEKERFNKVNKIDGIYFINKNYEIKKSNKIEKLTNNILQGRAYPVKAFFLENIKSYTHRIIARIFVPNPNPGEYDLVNHINMCYSEFSKENLEWVNIKINNSSKKRKKKVLTKWYDQIDPISIKVIKAWGYRELKRSGFSIKLIKKSIENQSIYKGFLWKENNKDLEKYLVKHPYIKDGWFTNKFISTHKIEANLNGVLKINGRITIGSLDKNGYRVIRLTYNNKTNSYKAHRLIYETISGKKIPKGYVIDHIIPVSKEEINNEYSNLRICTHKENMNNELTKNKFTKSISKYSVLGEFINTYDTLKYIDIPTVNDFNALKNTPEKYGYIWDTELSSVYNKMRYIYYKFDEAGNLISANKFLKKLIDKPSSTISTTYKKYINTGMKTPDGYYYQQGNPENFIIDNSNTSLKKKRDIITWGKEERP